MLQLKLNQAPQLDAEGKRLLLLDSTDLYSPLNLTGYGNPNLDRSSIAVFIVGYLNTAKGDKRPIVFDSYNPLTATSWNAVSSGDGWYSFYLVYSLIDSTPLISNYSEGDIIYDSTLNKLLKVGRLSPLLPLLFLPAQPEDLLSKNSSVVVDQLFIPTLSFQKIRINQKKLELLLDSENLSNSKKLVTIQKAYDNLRSVIQGAIYEFCRGNKYVAARYIEFLLTNNYDQL